MMEIRDATSRTAAKVSDLQQLAVEASQLSRMAYISRETGEAFSWTAATADLAAADTALLVANIHSTKKLYIGKIYIYTDVPSRLQIHLPAYPTLAGTAVTGICLNRAKSFDPAAYSLSYADETGNTQANIIKVLDSNELTTDQFGCWWDFEGAVILPYRGCIAVDVVGDSAAFDCSIEGWYE
jgi:hypothetical protein